jgi:hypothetical protein
MPAERADEQSRQRAPDDPLEALASGRAGVLFVERCAVLQQEQRPSLWVRLCGGHASRIGTRGGRPRSLARV